MQKAIQANDKRNETILNHQGSKIFVGFLKPTISYKSNVSVVGRSRGHPFVQVITNVVKSLVQNSNMPITSPDQ